MAIPPSYWRSFPNKISADPFLLDLKFSSPPITNNKGIYWKKSYSTTSHNVCKHYNWDPDVVNEEETVKLRKMDNLLSELGKKY